MNNFDRAELTMEALLKVVKKDVNHVPFWRPFRKKNLKFNYLNLVDALDMYRNNLSLASKAEYVQVFATWIFSVAIFFETIGDEERAQDYENISKDFTKLSMNMTIPSSEHWSI